MLTLLGFPISFLMFCSKITIHLIDCFQIAVIKLYRMLDKAEFIVINEISNIHVCKNSIEVEIQKTQRGVVLKVVCFEMIVSTTILMSLETCNTMTVNYIFSGDS